MSLLPYLVRHSPLNAAVLGRERRRRGDGDRDGRGAAGQVRKDEPLLVVRLAEDLIVAQVEPIPHTEPTSMVMD